MATSYEDEPKGCLPLRAHVQMQHCILEKVSLLILS